VIVNKVHYEADEEAEGAAEDDLQGLLDDDLAERVAENFADLPGARPARREERPKQACASEINPPGG